MNYFSYGKRGVIFNFRIIICGGYVSAVFPKGKTNKQDNG